MGKRKADFAKLSGGTAKELVNDPEKGGGPSNSDVVRVALPGAVGRARQAVAPHEGAGRPVGGSTSRSGSAPLKNDSQQGLDPPWEVAPGAENLNITKGTPELGKGGIDDR